VNLMLLGFGLPSISANDLPVNTFLSPDQAFAPVCSGTGNGVVAGPAAGEDFIDLSTQTGYWGRQTLEIDLPETGTYFLVVASADGSAGKYVLNTGTEDSFKWGDLLRFPVSWIKVHNYFGHTPWLVGGLAAVLGLLAGGIVLGHRLRSRRKSVSAGRT
jgi:hypothetical protein